MSDLESAFLVDLMATGCPEPEREHKFHPKRRWRFDFAWPALRVAAEIEGGTWINGRHNRGTGFEKDCEKYNAAALAGWTVLRFGANAIKSGEAVKTTLIAVVMREAQRETA